ncbi:MAG TPA: hemin ABC transporter substrate-binding protein [Dehalococcoidia bacterium]|nr:hemin ABC transporter substrate-binding protein [Dehalococcoidia bacterium]
MRPRILALVLFLGFGIFAAACGDSDKEAPTPTAPPQAQRESAPVLPATVTDKDGKSVTVKDVSRIIPLNGDIAEIVAALGLQEKIVGADISATYPAELQKLPSIGYQRTLSAEGILSLNPTVIIGNEGAGPPQVIEQIKAIGVPVVLIKSTTTLEGISTKIKAIGAALGVPVRAAELAAATDKDIADARAKASKATTKPKVMFLYIRGASTQVIMGEGSGADALITAAGGIDSGVAAGIKGTKPITPEALVAAQPDSFLVLTAGLASVGGISGLLQIPGVTQTPAGINKKVIDMDDQYLLGLGPRAGKALMDLVKFFHPELN